MFDYASKLINSEIDEAIPKMVEMHFAKYCYFNSLQNYCYVCLDKLYKILRLSEMFCEKYDIIVESQNITFF